MSELVWLENTDGVKIQVDRQSLPHYIGRWQETGPPPQRSTAELDAELLANAGYAEEPVADEKPASYAGWLKADLVAEAASRGLDITGTKDDLITRLEDNESLPESDQEESE